MKLVKDTDINKQKNKISDRPNPFSNSKYKPQKKKRNHLFIAKI